MHGGKPDMAREPALEVSSAPAAAPTGAMGLPEAFPRLFLASRSPRRRELLALYRIDHDADHPGFDDSHLQPGHTSPRAWVTSLANLKALAGYDLLKLRAREVEFDYVLGADTTCVRDGRVLGTPRDADDARRIIVELRGGEHDVITGVALVPANTPRPGRRRILFADLATVRMGMISDAEIDRYIASGKWQGKAGAYNLHERIDAGWPVSFVGDPTTITGLPMGMLMRVLRRLGPGIRGSRGASAPTSVVPTAAS